MLRKVVRCFFAGVIVHPVRKHWRTTEKRNNLSAKRQRLSAQTVFCALTRPRSSHDGFVFVAFRKEFSNDRQAQSLCQRGRCLIVLEYSETHQGMPRLRDSAAH